MSAAHQTSSSDFLLRDIEKTSSELKTLLASQMTQVEAADSRVDELERLVTRVKEKIREIRERRTKMMASQENLQDIQSSLQCLHSEVQKMDIQHQSVCLRNYQVLEKEASTASEVVELENDVKSLLLCELVS